MANYNNRYRNSDGNKRWGRRKDTKERNSDGGQPDKFTGCQKGVGGESKKPWVSGWNKSAQGYMTFLAFPYQKTKRSTSENGVEWENWIARITYPDRKVALMPVLVEVKTMRVFFKDINMIANPGAPHGGYWGRMVNKNNR